MAYQCEFDDRVVGQIDRPTNIGAIFLWLGEDSNGLYLPVTEVIQACTQVSHCMDRPYRYPGPERLHTNQVDVLIERDMRIQSPEMRHGRPERRQLELGRMQRIGQHPDQLPLAGDLAILIRNLHVTRAAQLVLGQTQVQVRLHGLGGAVEEAQGEGFGVDGRGLERNVEGGVKADGEGLGGRVEKLRLVDGEGSVVDDSLGDGRDAYFEAGGGQSMR